MYQKKKVSFVLAVALILTIFVGCAAKNENTMSASSEETTAKSKAQEAQESSALPESPPEPLIKTKVRVGSLKGPSSLGMLGIMDKNEQKATNNDYEFEILGAPTEIQGKLINGTLDIAAVPINAASALYNKTDKGITTIAVGTLGVLYLLTKDEEISSFKDLEGKTIYLAAQGSTPEYVLNYLIEKNGMTGKVNVEFKAEHAEIAALMLAGQANIALLPQPFATTVTIKNADIKIALDLNEEWRKVADSELAMTCIVVRNEFLKSNKQAVDTFLDEYKVSTEFVNTNVEEAAQLSEKYDIVAANIAEIAISRCGIVFIDGANMKTAANPVLEVLHGANPQSVGGNLPDDAFYYQR